MGWWAGAYLAESDYQRMRISLGSLYASRNTKGGNGHWNAFNSLAIPSVDLPPKS